MRYCFIVFEWQFIKKKKKLTGKEEYEEKLDYLYAVCGNAASKENSMKATPNIKNRKKKKRKIELAYNLAIVVLGTHPEEFQSTSQSALCTATLLTILFTTAKIVKPPK